MSNIFTAIAWRPRTFGVDGYEGSEPSWDVRRVQIALDPAPEWRMGHATVVDLTSKAELTRWQEQPLVARKPKTPLLDMVTVEGAKPFMKTSISWDVIPEKDLPAYLENLRTQRDQLIKDRKWVKLREVAEKIHLLEPWTKNP